MCPASPNELFPRESLQQTHFRVRTHQPREQISGNYCIRLMILSSGKYSSSHAGSPKHWGSFPCAVLLTRIPRHLACFLCHPNVFDFSQYFASISSWRNTGLYLTAQDRIIHQSWQQLCSPGQDKTRLGFLILCILFPYSSCFWNKVTFNNLPSKLPFIACSRRQPWNRFAEKAGSATLSEIS